MNKQQYVEEAFRIIRAKNIESPFELVPGSLVTDLEKYMEVLRLGYLESKSPKIEKLFVDKIEFLKNF